MSVVLPFWYRLTQVVPDKGPLNGCVCVAINVHLPFLYVADVDIVNAVGLQWVRLFSWRRCVHCSPVSECWPPATLTPVLTGFNATLAHSTKSLSPDSPHSTEHSPADWLLPRPGTGFLCPSASKEWRLHVNSWTNRDKLNASSAHYYSV